MQPNELNTNTNKTNKLRDLPESAFLLNFFWSLLLVFCFGRLVNTYFLHSARCSPNH